jgi:hypothetical protein
MKTLTKHGNCHVPVLMKQHSVLLCLLSSALSL